MGQMNYKTRGMSTTKGKPRIYFSSHPKDYVQYFETISDDILECGNNAIWFMEGEVSDRKMHEQDLKEMQLIVIPVTKIFENAEQVK